MLTPVHRIPYCDTRIWAGYGHKVVMLALQHISGVGTQRPLFSSNDFQQSSSRMNHQRCRCPLSTEAGYRPACTRSTCLHRRGLHQVQVGSGDDCWLWLLAIWKKGCIAMQRSLLSAVLQLQSLGCGSGLPACTRAVSHASHALVGSTERSEEQKSKDASAAPPGPLPTLPCLLRGRSSLLGSPAARPFRNHQLRFMGGHGPDTGTTTSENTWLEYRTKYAEPKPNDLGQAMYALILTFGFAALLNDFMAYPPRVVMMLGVTFYVLYMRR